MTTTELENKAANGRAYHHGDLRNALLRSALDLLEGQGLEAMSLRAVARKAGVSQAAPYHHFKDKQAIMAGVATIGHVMLADKAREYRDIKDDGFPSIIRMGAGYVAFAKDNPNLFRLMFGPELTDFKGDKAYLEATEAGWDLIHSRIAKVLSTHKKPPQQEIERSALVAWCFVHGLATLIVDNKIPSPETSDPDFLKFVFDLFAVIEG